MERKNCMLQLAERMDLPSEPIPGIPVVELAGDCRVLIEKHGGILGYEENLIRIKMRYGQLHVRGNGLEISSVSVHQIVIRGKIQGIELRKGD